MSKDTLRLRVGSFRFLFLVLCLLVATSPSLRAQTSSTGALVGTVTDASGAIVPNATVTATAETGQSRTATTGPDGTFKFGLLPPGKYLVRIVASGFQVEEIPAVDVNVTETSVLNRAMRVGAQTQTVTVEGSVETLQTTNSTLGTVAPGETVTALPLNTRNYTNLLSM